MHTFPFSSLDRRLHGNGVLAFNIRRAWNPHRRINMCFEPSFSAALGHTIMVFLAGT
jgi:hypothetical protein